MRLPAANGHSAEGSPSIVLSTWRPGWSADSAGAKKSRVPRRLRPSGNVQVSVCALVAAAGTGGRNAPPAYPAAHERVLGVTAVSADRRVYWRANQGDYIDYALPGVNVWTADPAGGGRARSGTSYAVPYMVALASQTLAQRVASRDVLLDGQLGGLADLGDPGRDPVFGYGKPRFDRDCR